MITKARSALIVIMFGFCAYSNVRQGGDWLRERPKPLKLWLDELDTKLPRDARLLLDAPADNLKSDHYRVNSRLHPRAVYALPPGVRSVEEAGDWIARKRIGWIVSIGGPSFDADRALVNGATLRFVSAVRLRSLALQAVRRAGGSRSRVSAFGSAMLPLLRLGS